MKSCLYSTQKLGETNIGKTINALIYLNDSIPRQ